MSVAVFLLSVLMTGFPNLEQLRWHNRVVLIFADSDDDAQLKKQKKTIEWNAQGFEERQLKVFTLSGHAEDVQTLRKKLGLPESGFAVVLIGKDGGVKLSKTSPLGTKELFEVIDQMPMRKAEMRQQGD